MPLFDCKCPRCGSEDEVFQHTTQYNPICKTCGSEMNRLLSAPAMWKIKGAGGFPSKRNTGRCSIREAVDCRIERVSVRRHRHT